jgi:hypothetical protein
MQTITMWKDGGFDLGNQWNYGQFGFYFQNPYSVIIQASTGSSTGFIGLDDIYFKEAQYCSVFPDNAAGGGNLPLPQLTTTTKNPLLTPSSSIYFCDFEINLCNWKNDLSVRLTWIRNRGSTLSLDTGPTTDHT